MKDFFQAGMAIILCVFAFFLIQRAKRKLLLPVKCGSGVKLSIVIEASGRAPGLENTLKCAKMLQENCRKATFIIIKDEGLDEEARRIAELFAAKNPLSDLWSAEITGDEPCRKKDSKSE